MTGNGGGAFLRPRTLRLDASIEAVEIVVSGQRVILIFLKHPKRRERVYHLKTTPKGGLQLVGLNPIGS